MNQQASFLSLECMTKLTCRGQSGSVGLLPMQKVPLVNAGLNHLPMRFLSARAFTVSTPVNDSQMTGKQLPSSVMDAG